MTIWLQLCVCVNGITTSLFVCDRCVHLPTCYTPRPSLLSPPANATWSLHKILSFLCLPTPPTMFWVFWVQNCTNHTRCGYRLLITAASRCVSRTLSPEASPASYGAYLRSLMYGQCYLRLPMHFFGSRILPSPYCPHLSR